LNKAYIDSLKRQIRAVRQFKVITTKTGMKKTKNIDLFLNEIAKII